MRSRVCQALRKEGRPAAFLAALALVLQALIGPASQAAAPVFGILCAAQSDASPDKTAPAPHDAACPCPCPASCSAPAAARPEDGSAFAPPRRAGRERPQPRARQAAPPRRLRSDPIRGPPSTAV